MNRGTNATRMPIPAPPAPGLRPRRTRTSAARELAASLLGTAVGATALLVLLTLARHAPPLIRGAARADDVLLLLIMWLGAGLAGWLALGSLLAALALLPGAAGRLAGRLAERVTPLAVRRLLTFTLGAAVGSCALPSAPMANASTASVDAGRNGAGAAAGHAGAGLLPGYAPTAPEAPRAKASGTPVAGARVDDGPGFLPTLDRPGPRRLDAPPPPATSAPAPTRGPGYLPSAPPPVHDADRPRLLAPAPRAATSTHELVTVRRGDSLWSIAARHMGTGATDTEVAHEWPRWYEANRAVIGDDPDLLVPGQQLRPPPGRHAGPAAPGVVGAAATGGRR
ncbi:LysM peptidoglycan-binding domain-containing protein [Terrabacter sp. NPDC080008]|uniref:LysM peptidoglycan-binding domain-containing protein n=1 Tax=Terrabacter sp. NPDC080008 TaxID=3155176 RepID=UPI00344C07D8